MLSKAISSTFFASPFVQNALRYSSISLATSAGNYNTPFMTSNKFVLVHYPVVGDPEINLTSKSKPITLRPEMSLRELENQLKQNQDATSKVDFLAQDGIPVAKSTTLQHLLDLPHFLVKIDGTREYNFISEKSFSYRNSKFTMSGQ